MQPLSYPPAVHSPSTRLTRGAVDAPVNSTQPRPILAMSATSPTSSERNYNLEHKPMRLRGGCIPFCCPVRTFYCSSLKATLTIGPSAATAKDAAVSFEVLAFIRRGRTFRRLSLLNSIFAFPKHVAEAARCLYFPRHSAGHISPLWTDSRSYLPLIFVSVVPHTGHSGRHIEVYSYRNGQSR